MSDRVVNEAALRAAKGDYLAAVHEAIMTRFHHVASGVIAVHFHDRWPAEAVDCWITVGHEADPAIVEQVRNWIHSRGPVRTWMGDLGFYVRQAKPIGDDPRKSDPREEAFWSAAFCAAVASASLQPGERIVSGKEDEFAGQVTYVSAKIADAALTEWRKRWGAK